MKKGIVFAGATNIHNHPTEREKVKCLQICSIVVPAALGRKILAFAVFFTSFVLWAIVGVSYSVRKGTEIDLDAGKVRVVSEKNAVRIQICINNFALMQRGNRFVDVSQQS